MINRVNVKLKGRNGATNSYYSKETITIPRAGSDEEVETFTAGQPLDNTEIELDFSTGDQFVDAPEGYVMRSGLINKPDDLEEIIAKGETFAGVAGEYVTPGTVKSVSSLDFSSSDCYTVSVSGDERWGQVDVFKPAGLISENIPEGITIAGIPGSLKDKTWEIIDGTFSGAVSSNADSLRPFALAGLSNVNGVSFPECTTIGYGAFWSCTGLFSASFPKCSVVSASAFCYCSNLTNIYMPSLAKINGAYAFYDVTLSGVSFPSLSSIVTTGLGGAIIYNLYSTFPAFSYFSPSVLSRAIICDTSLYSSTFSTTYAFPYVKLRNCTFADLSEISTPYFQYTTLDNCAFELYSWSNLYSSAFYMASIWNMSIKFPNAYSGVGGVYGFRYAKLSNVVFSGTDPGHVQSSYPFTGATFYKTYFDNVTFSTYSSTTYSGYKGLFSGATLTDCVFGKVKGPIWRSNFLSATLSGWLSFPSCTMVQSSTFSGKGLEGIALPNCSNISTSAFYNCSKLKSVYILGSSYITLQDGNVFALTPLSSTYTGGTFGSFFCRASMLENYKKRTYWSAYSSRFVGLTDQEIEEVQKMFIILNKQ